MSFQYFSGQVRGLRGPGLTAEEAADVAVAVALGPTVESQGERITAAETAIGTKAEAAAVVQGLDTLQGNLNGVAALSLERDNVLGARIDGLGSAASRPASDFATAAQGTKADTAVQPSALGSAASRPASDFATAAQGGKADTAVQPSALGSAASRPASDFATAAQGTKADTAVQPSALGSAASRSASDFAAAADGLTQPDRDKIAAVPDKADKTALATEVDTRRKSAKAALAAPLRLALQGGLFQVILGGRRLPLALDRFGRLLGTLAAPAEPPAVITGGNIPLARDRDGRSLVWLDMRRRRLRSVGDDLDRDDSVPAPFAVLAGRNAIQTVGAEGQVYNPSAATAPIAYDAPVADAGGPSVRQIFMCDGTRVQRLTASQVDCFNPEIIAPGIVRYARADGRIGLARAPRGDLLASSSLRMYCVHGQSLAGGSSSFAPGTQPNLRYPPEPRVRMFNGGVRAAFGSGAYNEANFTSLADAKEVLGPDNMLSDTGMTAFGFALTRDQGGEVLVTSTGVGGAAYDVIGPGTQPWANMVYGMDRAVALAGDVTVEALQWRHGESQEQDDAAAYTTKINDAHSAFIAAAQAATSKTNVPVMILQQINRMEETGRGAGPLAYRLEGPGWAVANIAIGTDATKLVIGPQYPSLFGDQYHMLPDGYDYMATQVAKVMTRHKYRRWQPLHAKSAVRMGRVVEVTFGGGWLDWGGALTLDTSLVSDPGNFGFSWYDVEGVITVCNVQVISRTMVRIILSAAPISAGGVGIAFFSPTELDNQGPTTGLRSCLRDNDPSACPVTGRPHHNYAISQTIGATIA